MNTQNPGPDDDFHKVFEFDCSANLPPELKAKLRIGKFLPVDPPPHGSDLLNEGDR